MPSAFGYFPSAGEAAGDSWYRNGGLYDDPRLGSFAYNEGFMHEIGHTLGLRHGHDAGNPFNALPTDWDSNEFTVMTYRDFIGDGVDGSENEAWGNPQSYMMLDIAALQYMFGADYSSFGNIWSGDSTYRFDPDTGETTVNGTSLGMPGGNRIFRTIWDGHGFDTYDLSNYSSDLDINLGPGEWSTFSDIQLAVLDGISIEARGNVANALLYNGDLRSLIERAIGGTGNDTIIGNVADNWLNGGDGNDELSGLGGADHLSGDGGDDILTGQEGSDDLMGGHGNDLLSGHQDDDFLLGGDGHDRLHGGAGNDRLFGDAVGIVFINGVELSPITGNDTLYGDDGDDWLDGGNGDDFLDGGAGHDALYAGAGNDIFMLSTQGDHYDGGTGIDLLNATTRQFSPSPSGFGGTSFPLSRTLEIDLEQGLITHTSFIGGVLHVGTIANVENVLGLADFASTIRGDAAANHFRGGTQGDTLDGRDGNDTLEGFGGNDNLIGGRGLDLLFGGEGDDTINGGGDVDTMRGGAGNDTYFVNSGQDVIIELFGEGSDTVRSTTSITLSENVENLVLVGSSSLSGTGNALSNRITGNAAANIINGGGGKDILIGGGGDDSFVFDFELATTSSVGRIADFRSGSDRILLDDEIFSSFGSIGDLDIDAFFVMGTGQRRDAEDRVMYNPANGSLFYDADGNGSEEAIRFATVSQGMVLGSGDFLIM
ncbi:MAG: M10 family metallopeptidase C-terminal domain-containing protein [Hyphomicrobium sp.]